jgi:DNA-binding LacI/PurR family transcriptional regulator
MTDIASSTMPNDEAIVEAMAQGLAAADHIDELSWEDCKRYAQAALDAQRARGLVVVPVEPTEAMLKAARNAQIPLVYLDSIAAAQDLDFLSRYRAMIAVRDYIKEQHHAE